MKKVHLISCNSFLIFFFLFISCESNEISKAKDLMEREYFENALKLIEMELQMNPKDVDVIYLKVECLLHLVLSEELTGKRRNQDSENTYAAKLKEAIQTSILLDSSSDDDLAQIFFDSGIKMFSDDELVLNPNRLRNELIFIFGLGAELNALGNEESINELYNILEEDYEALLDRITTSTTEDELSDLFGEINSNESIWKYFRNRTEILSKVSSSKRVEISELYLAIAESILKIELKSYYYPEIFALSDNLIEDAVKINPKIKHSVAEVLFENGKILSGQGLSMGFTFLQDAANFNSKFSPEVAKILLEEAKKSLDENEIDMAMNIFNKCINYNSSITSDVTDMLKLKAEYYETEKKDQLSFRCAEEVIKLKPNEKSWYDKFIERNVPYFINQDFVNGSPVANSLVQSLLASIFLNSYEKFESLYLTDKDIAFIANSTMDGVYRYSLYPLSDFAERKNRTTQARDRIIKDLLKRRDRNLLSFDPFRKKMGNKSEMIKIQVFSINLFSDNADNDLNDKCCVEQIYVSYKFSESGRSNSITIDCFHVPSGKELKISRINL